MNSFREFRTKGIKYYGIMHANKGESTFTETQIIITKKKLDLNEPSQEVSILIILIY